MEMEYVTLRTDCWVISFANNRGINQLYAHLFHAWNIKIFLKIISYYKFIFGILIIQYLPSHYYIKTTRYLIL